MHGILTTGFDRLSAFEHRMRSVERAQYERLHGDRDTLSAGDDGASLHASGGYYTRLLWDAIRGCGNCHTCGSTLTYNLTCPACGVRRRYSCHGYLGDDGDSTPCMEVRL